MSPYSFPTTITITPRALPENGFILKKARSRRYFAETITDADDRELLQIHLPKPNPYCIALCKQNEVHVF